MATKILVLEDGSIYEGEAFGADTAVSGEVVFSTGMCGYQEILADPAYKGQIVVMTFPLIGNYGVAADFMERNIVTAAGLVVTEYFDGTPSMYGNGPFGEYLVKQNVPGISGIDTRDIAIKIRNGGTLKGAIVSDLDAAKKALSEFKAMRLADEDNLVAGMACKKAYTVKGDGPKVALLDFGEKPSTIAALSARYNLAVFPYDATADAIIASGVRGVIVSDGPGNPAHPGVAPAVKTVSELAKKLPVLGLSYGAMVTALAMGAKTERMKAGHHGCNYSVKCGRRVHIVSESREYTVVESSLKGAGLIMDQFNINDKVVEGFVHEKLPVRGVLYHPDPSEGRWDTTFVFDEFTAQVKGESQ